MASVIWILSVVLYAEFMCAVSADMTTWRPGEKRPLMLINDKVREPEDPRFSYKQSQLSGSNIDVSFLVRNTMRTDEGGNECEIVTDSGEAKAVVSLSVTELVSLDCQVENHGVHGKDSLLKCFLNSGGERVTLISASWWRPGGKRPLIMFINDKVLEPEDPRFAFKQLQMSGSNIDVSFQVRNTLWTDEGKYECDVATDYGDAKAVVSLSVTANYSKPVMSSVPEKDLQEGMEVTLFCNASGGYPVGMIHWYDQHGTNWTRSAEMTVVEATDKRTNLSSKFTLKASSSAPQYWCLVLNNNGVEEGKAEFVLKLRGKAPGKVEGDGTAQTDSTAIAVVFVIVGSLLCGVLILALRRRRTQREAGATRGGSCWRSHGGNGRRGTRAEEHLEGDFPAGAEGYVPSTPGDAAGPRQPSRPGGNLTGGTVEGPSAPIQSSPAGSPCQDHPCTRAEAGI